MDDKLIEQIKADRKAGTPGPWEFRDPMLHDDNHPNEIIGPSEGARRYGEKGVRSLCEFDEDEIYEGDPLAVANARRVARVPDMENRILTDAKVIEAAKDLKADVLEVQAYRAQCAHGSVNLSALALKMKAVEETLAAFNEALDALEGKDTDNDE